MSRVEPRSELADAAGPGTEGSSRGGDVRSVPQPSNEHFRTPAEAHDAYSEAGRAGEMSPPAMFKFRLYVAGDAGNSAQAIANLAALCRKYLPDRHQIEVVDVFLNQKRALKDGIYLTPVLVKFAPAPVRNIVGTLSQAHEVLSALGLEALPV